MISNGFEERWNWITKRGAHRVVQDRKELEHIYNLMFGCENYLEVGSAEGDSLYVLSNAVREGGRITYIDWNESHTEPLRVQAIREINGKRSIKGIHYNAHDSEAINMAFSGMSYDCVLIDAGHSYEDALADGIVYGSMARKYIFFHDIQIPSVKRAFDWICKNCNFGKPSVFINSENYGYGIIEIKP